MAEIDRQKRLDALRDASKNVCALTLQSINKFFFNTNMRGYTLKIANIDYDQNGGKLKNAVRQCLRRNYFSIKIVTINALKALDCMNSVSDRVLYTLPAHVSLAFKQLKKQWYLGECNVKALEIFVKSLKQNELSQFVVDLFEYTDNTGTGSEAEDSPPAVSNSQLTNPPKLFIDLIEGVCDFKYTLNEVLHVLSVYYLGEKTKRIIDNTLANILMYAHQQWSFNFCKLLKEGIYSILHQAPFRVDKDYRFIYRYQLLFSQYDGTLRGLVPNHTPKKHTSTTTHHPPISTIVS
ncbi:AgseGVORF71-like protein [Hyphantria cunea granulovirus]|uniref:AgseGVORF71-like protein n=1 Tax=Hyphantria cunea granulovirus TaxID=307448 RepID=A0AAE6D026_9BBAC|nr:AgseGVORF71-like protein [Hyphantria cunea granulovirus]QBQ01622.1 AgseGVORF71-like protein [Hyphantria cunea granulovirus]